MANYKYDIALSLCKEDTDFARNLVRQLNPGLKVFYYENNQEDIISQSGPEIFGKVFKEARVVVILSRKEWSETFYTKIEMHSINDRTRTEGYDYLVVIPMVPNEIPVWYPKTMIYADPLNITLEVIANIVEYKVAERGGVVKQLTVEDQYQHLLIRIENKKKLIQLQSSEDALMEIIDEMKTILTIVNQKIELLKNPTIGTTDRYIVTSIPNLQAYFAINDYLLEIKILSPDEIYHKIVTTQDYTLSIQLYKFFGSFKHNYLSTENRKLIKGQFYKFLYDSNKLGWACPFVYDKISKNEVMVLFSHRDTESLQVVNRYYDLKNPKSSEEIIDGWFQQLLKLATSKIEQYI
jgi:hypothetical protein